MRARLFALSRRVVAGVLLALPLACLHIGSSLEPSRTELAVAGMALECPVGGEGCPCTAGGGCDPGLTCISGICSYGAAMGGEIMYEFDEDALAYPEPAPSMDSGPARGGRWERVESKRRDKGRDRESRRFAEPSGAAAPETATTGSGALMPTPVAGSTTPNEQPATPSLAEQGRQIIYTATLHVAVFGLDAAIEFAESVPERYGGWIESRYDYQITLRIPAERLFEVIEQLSALGVVLGKTLQADDVTAEYIDLEARILILEHIVAQLELLLKQATSVEQALQIRVELDRMRLELESARAQMRQLAEMIDFSTLTLYLSARGPEVERSSNDPFPWVDQLGAEATEYR